MRLWTAIWAPAVPGKTPLRVIGEFPWANDPGAGSFRSGNGAIREGSLIRGRVARIFPMCRHERARARASHITLREIIGMKSDLSYLLQHSRRRFGGPNPTGRTTSSGSTATGTGLRPEDGFDWLRRIKPIRTGQRAGR